jgi:multidrug efflux pump subunit AcrB
VLESVDGVGQVSMNGGRAREIHIVVDIEKLNSYGLTIDQVRDAIQKENVEIPGGTLEQGKWEVGLRTLGRVVVSGGRLAGGTTIARAGITAGQVGAAGATGTLLVAGVDYLIEPRVARMEEDLARLEDRSHAIPAEIAGNATVSAPSSSARRRLSR